MRQFENYYFVKSRNILIKNIYLVFTKFFLNNFTFYPHPNLPPRGTELVLASRLGGTGKGVI